MKVRFGLQARFTVLFFIFSLVIIGTLQFLTMKNYEGTVYQKYEEEASETAQLAADVIDGDKLLEYSRTLKPDEEYYKTLDMLNVIKRNTGVEYLYVIKPISDDATIYIYEAWEPLEKTEETALLGEIGPYDDETFKSAKEAMRTGKPSGSLDITNTQFGLLASAYAPIFDSDGNTIALVGVDIEMRDIKGTIDTNVNRLLIAICFIIVICFCLLLMITHITVISPIRILKGGVQKMSEGELGVQVPVIGRTEISEISDAFNKMSFNIAGNIAEVTKLNRGYYRFVPAIILDFLQKKNIYDLQPGNNREVNITVMGMLSSSFQEMTENMNSQELFDYINRIYQLAVPMIQEKNGVVESYNREGLSAVYTGEKRDALDSAISICQKLNERNAAKADDEKKTELVFGITAGKVMVGIAGHDLRLSSIMISEQIDIMNHLKNAAGKYGARILITEDAAREIWDFDRSYHSRFLGYISVGKEGRKIRIYDVYDGDKKEDRIRKEMTKEKFEEGVSLFIQGKFPEARRCFIEVLRRFGKDYASREYLYLCNYYYEHSETEEVYDFIEEVKI